MHTDINTLEDIRILVDSFYKRAAKDDLLGSIFISVTDAQEQKEILYKYWFDVLLNEHATSPVGFPDHIRLMFSRQHFIRWLTLFLETIDLLYAGNTAEKAKVTVIKKSEEFQVGMELPGF